MESRTNLWSFFTGTRNEGKSEHKTRWETNAGILNAVQVSGMRHFGDLTIGNLLGQGTSFTVHSCVRHAPRCEGTAVAIKRPKVPKKVTVQDVARTIYTELLLMAHNPLHEDSNIVQILGYRWFPFEMYPSVLVENAHFGTLDRYLHMRGKFAGAEWEECHRLCLDVARALTSVHAQGIIHSDVKPQNVLVCLPEGPHDPDAVVTARLTDFSHSNFNVGYDDSTFQLGTPLFSAPELLSTFYDSDYKARLAKEDLPKCDVWSFGLVAWCIMTCQANFFQDDWLLPPHDRPPQRLQFILSQPADFFQSMAYRMMKNPEEFVDMPLNMRASFAKLLKGCLEGASCRRFSMQESSRLLDFSGQYDHPAADFEMNAPNGDKQTLLTLDISSITSVHCPWHVRTSIFEGIASQARERKPGTQALQRYIGILSIPTSHSTSDSDDFGNFAYNLASCYANGFGVKKDFGIMLNSLRNSSDLDFMEKQKERISLALSADASMLDAKGDDDDEWLSRSIIEYQKTARQQYINTIQYVKVAQHADLCQPQDVQDHLCAMSNVHLTQVQVVFENETFSHPWLHYAVLTNDISLACNLIRRGYPIDILDREERTALFEACCLGNVEMVSFLLENGANPSLVEDTGVAPLHLLIFFEPAVIHDVATQLMAGGANIYAQTRRDHAWTLPWHGISLAGTPLHFAISCRNMVAIKTLLHFGADPNQRAGFLSSLDLAASFNLPEICALLIEHGATTNTHWFAGRSPLHWIGDPTFCSPLGKLIIHGPKYRDAVASCVDILLSHDAVIDEPDNGYYLGENMNSTPLDIAAASQAMDETVISVLLEKQLSLRTPVKTEVIFSTISASQNDHVNCPAFQFLYQCRGMPWYNIPGHQIWRADGETALHDCVKKDAVSVLKEMLAHPGLNVNERNGQGFTALHYACQFASNECVDLLLNHGADIELKSHLPTPGYTALGLAAISRRIDLVTRLLNAGADLWLGNETNDGPTFLHLAAGPDLVQQIMRSPRSAKRSLGGITCLPQDESVLGELLEELLPESAIERLQQDASLLNAQHPLLGTALHVAVENGAPRVAEILLELGADSKIKDQYGHTPLESFKEAYANLEFAKGRLLNEFQLYIEEISQILTGWKQACGRHES